MKWNLSNGRLIKQTNQLTDILSSPQQPVCNPITTTEHTKSIRLLVKTNMKGYLLSQDGSYAFPLGPKVTTIGRENCDISINSPCVDHQHALIEHDDEQRCFILKDLNSSSGTYVHDCRVQNAAVRLADEDIIRFGYNGLPLQLRIEHQQQQQEITTMPSIYPRQPASNCLQMITQTIPSRRIASCTNTHQQQQIDVRQNPGFSLRTRPSSAGSKKPPVITTHCQTSNGVRESLVRPNAWTVTTNHSGRSVISGSFSGELDLPNADNTEINNRVDQLEKEVKGRDAEIRDLNDRLRHLEPLSSTFTNEVNALRTELEKVKREKQAASGLVSTLKRDLTSKDSTIAKLTRDIEGFKTESRDKDLRLQALQSKLNHLRERSRAEDDRNSKEKDLKIKMNEQQITELNESIVRLKAQLQDTEKQLSRTRQNEEKHKQECEHAREQLADTQRNDTTLKSELANVQRKYHEFCVNIWRCFSADENDEYNEDEHDIIEQIRQLQRQVEQLTRAMEIQRGEFSSNEEQLRNSLEKFLDILMNCMHQQTTINILNQARQQILEENENIDENTPIGMFRKSIVHVIDCHVKLIVQVNQSIDDQNQDLTIEESFAILRRRLLEFERERESFAADRASYEQIHQVKYDELIAEKDAFWQQRLNEETSRLHEQLEKLQHEYDEQSQLFSRQIETLTRQNEEYQQQLIALQTDSSGTIEELRMKLQDYERQLSEERERQKELTDLNEKLNERLLELEKEKNSTTEDLNGQVQVYQDQVRQFSITIVQLEKDLAEAKEKCIRLQADLDHLNQKTSESTSSAAVETVIPVVPVLTAPLADLSHELFAYKSRVQEQDQIILSLRRDLAGMTARLSDIQGELSEKQKQALEKSEATIREQSKDLNETRLKLAKLSEIVEQQSTQIDTLQSDLAKSKLLADEYQLLVDQRQEDIDRLRRTLEEKSAVVERVERTTQDEGRIASEFVAIGAQCKGERHEQTISRQREALNELRARIRTLEQLRPANPAYEKVLQQVVLLKRELAELRARQALPTDIPYLTTTPGSTSVHQQSQKPSASASRQSPTGSAHSDDYANAQKVLEERTAHAETTNSLQTFDELHNAFTRKLVQILDIDDDTLLNVMALSTAAPGDRQVALQQRQRTTEILTQKIEMLRERLTRKEELLRDYEKDLGKLRQAEILIREKDALLQDLEVDKRSKDDEALFLRNTLRETQDTLNQEKRVNSSIKLGRNIDQSQSNELIRRSGSSTGTLHHHCPPDSNGKVRTIKRNMHEKIARKDYEIKTLKQELHQALDTISEQSHQVKLLEFQSKDTKPNPNGFNSHH